MDLSVDIQARWGLQTPSFENKLFVFGGMFENKVYSDLYSFHFHVTNLPDSSISAFSVKREIIGNNFFPPAFKKFVSVVYGKKLFVFFGQSIQGSFTNHIYSFDLFDRTWEMIESSLPSLRHSSCFARLGNNLFIYGGISEDGSTLNV